VTKPVDHPQDPKPKSAVKAKAAVWKRVLQAAISLAIVVGIFVGVMPLIADYGDVFETIRAMTGLEGGSLVLIGLWNLATYWFVLTAALPGLRLREAAVVNQASTAVSNTLPAGGVIGVGVSIAMLTSWGFPIGSIGRSAVVTGIWNNFVKLGMPVLALSLLALEGGITSSAGRSGRYCGIGGCRGGLRFGAAQRSAGQNDWSRSGPCRRPGTPIASQGRGRRLGGALIDVPG